LVYFNNELKINCPAPDSSGKLFIKNLERIAGLGPNNKQLNYLFGKYQSKEGSQK